MTVLQSVLDAIGNTPLIRLKKASELTGCTILGKAEFLNPGQSVKDRAALFIIRDAERKGLLRPGGVIVEGTAGNTGIGLSMVARALGYRTVIVIPETQSQEKKDALRLLGAELIEVPAAPYKNPAPEIWRDTDGKVDGFVCAVGSGGTLAGVSLGLKEFNADIKIALADPHGAALYSHYTSGVMKSEGNSITEGIGQGRITANLEGFTPDLAYRIADAEALSIVYDLIEEEGLCLGGSSGINIAGAMHMAREMGPGHTIVTVLCDYGNRYQTKMFNPQFLREKQLPVPGWMEQTSDITVPYEAV